MLGRQPGLDGITKRQLDRLIFSATIEVAKINLVSTMNAATLYRAPHEIRGKLSFFGVDINEMQGIALEAVSARNEATPIHPSNAPGTFSYMAGVAALRMIFLNREGWKMYRNKGVEGVENPRLRTVVLFQNVDRACGIHDPNPISSKGEAVTQLVDNPSGYLWEYMADEAKANENSSVWFFCVSNDGEEVRAELSRPRAIKNGGFGAFPERIFIIQDNDWTPIDSDKGHEGDDFDVPVSKKG